MEKAECERSIAEDRLKKIFDNTQDAFLIHDLEGKILDVNDKMCRMYGLTKEEALGITIENVSSSKMSKADLQKKWQKALNGEQLLFEWEALRPKDGSVFNVEVSIQKISFHDKDIVLANVRDITDRKRAEAELQKSKLITDNIPVGLYLYHLEELSDDRTLRMVYANPVVRALTGLGPEDVVGKTLDENFPGLRSQGIPQRFAEVVRTQTAITFENITYGDSRAFLASFSVNAFPLPGNMVGIAFENITERRRAADSLRQRVDELAALNTFSRSINTSLSLKQTASTALADILETIQPDLTFLFLREGDRLVLFDLLPEAGRERLGEIPEHRVGEYMCGLAVHERRAIYSRDISADPRCTWGECRKAGIRSFAALPLCSGAEEVIGVIGLASKTERDFEQQGSYLETLAAQVSIAMANARLHEALMLELSERRQAEEALRQSQDTFRNLFEKSADAILLIDQSGVFVECNQAALNLLKMSRGEFMNRPPVIISPEFQPNGRRSDEAAQEMIDQAYARGLHRFDWTCVNSEGVEFIVDVSLMPILIKGQTMLHTTWRDITERKRAEEEREKLQAQLTQAQKMESLGILTGGVAHDFNNLLHTMRGNIELLAKNESLDSQGRTRLQTATRSMDRAAQLIQQLLLFGRKTGSRRMNVDLNQEVEDVVRVLERTIPRMVALELRLDPSVSPLFADPVQIEQVLLNLARNAVDAMPDGGTLMVETKNVVLDEAFIMSHPGSSAGLHVLLTVTDTGCGMDKEIMEHIFDPFFTTKEVGKGTGLGLASVYGIVKAHGGYIQCYSEPNQGTTFRVYLPVLNHGDTATAEPLRQAPNQGGNETILVVDDEPEIRELTREALEVLGYSVKMAVKGEQALDIYKEHGKAIDLVLLDLNMPGMGGYRCLQELLQLDPAVKVVIASGYTANAQGRDALSSGAKAFLNKPYQLKELAAMMREVLDGIKHPDNKDMRGWA
ncbi:MAG: PAS domain S-box protein [Desulfovibrionales bacterium]|nr:MAG: PAS domain S-box protein [Desulfovibrionales bacterium]